MSPNWERVRSNCVMGFLCLGPPDPATIKYDDASWHYRLDFPTGCPPHAAATHIGMFLAWAILSGLGGELHTVHFPENKYKLERRLLTPGRFLVRICDGKIFDDDLNDEGNQFAQAYFDFEYGRYLADYEETVGAELSTLYHVPDTWDTYAQLKPVLDRRLAECKAQAGLALDNPPFRRYYETED